MRPQEWREKTEKRLRTGRIVPKEKKDKSLLAASQTFLCSFSYMWPSSRSLTFELGATVKRKKNGVAAESWPVYDFLNIISLRWPGIQRANAILIFVDCHEVANLGSTHKETYDPRLSPQRLLASYFLFPHHHSLMLVCEWWMMVKKKIMTGQSFLCLIFLWPQTPWTFVCGQKER